MVWGCMGANGVGTLEFIEGTMDQHYYIDLLKRNLRPSVQQLHLPNNWTFQQDNDPKHTSWNAKMFLVHNVPHLMKSPAQSPDLNPIEHLWDHLERRIRNHKITSRSSLIEVIKQEWALIGRETCSNLVGSMKRRLHEVIKMKGHNTRY